MVDYEKTGVYINIVNSSGWYVIYFLVSVVIKYSMVSGSSSSFVVLYVLIKSKNPLNLQSLNNQSAEINVVNVNCKV